MRDSKYRDLRVIVAMPSQDSFRGHAFELASSLAQNWRDLGATVAGVVPEEWEDPSGRATLLSRLQRLDPHFAVALPNSGYGLAFRDGSGRNLFTDVLSIPLVLKWDHLLTQAPNYYLEEMYQAPQQTGALAVLRAGLANRLNRHYVPDSGHIAEYEGLKLLSPDSAARYMSSPDAHFVEAGVVPPNATEKNRVAFAGNIYTARGSKLHFLQYPLIREIDARLIEAKRRRWEQSGWHLFMEVLEQVPRESREKNGLTPDHPLFWTLAFNLLSFRVSTAYRLDVLNAIGLPVDFYGNFNDPDSSESLGQLGDIRFCGSVGYNSLPDLFRKYDVWVDVIHAPFINGCGSKAFNCFAAGSFMLMDYRADVLRDVGDVAKSFMYRSREEVKDKVSYYLTHPAERAAIIEEMQAVIRERLSIRHVYERMCDDMMAEPTSPRPTAGLHL